MNLYLVIMAGGSGTRFWPKSTSKKPKQLLSFADGQASLLNQTLARFDRIVRPENRIIVTTAALKNAVEQDATSVQVLAEPEGRNTAPCVYWAARKIAESDPKAVMLVMPSDHHIAEPSKFVKSVEEAAKWAIEHDDLVTLGVKPTRAETGYGYLKTGSALSGHCKKVDAFVEKPNSEKAEQFLKAGNYLWNGGMFVWRADVILAAFDRFLPEMKKAWDESKGDVRVAYPKMTATSIDYGIMEKAPNVVTFPLECGWDDLGSWTSLESLADVLEARREGNILTSGELVAVESRGNIVDARGKVVALLGVSDLIIVEHEGAILIAKKDRAQDIRLIVDAIKKNHPTLA